MKTYSDIHNEIIAFIQNGAMGSWFNNKDLYYELGLDTQIERKNANKVLSRMTLDGLIQPHRMKHGVHRAKDQHIEKIDWRSADASSELDLLLPFAMERFVKILPRNIIVIAGAPDAGKTAWAIDFTKKNMFNHTINYFSSEMGELELAVRLANHKDIKKAEWIFNPYDRTNNFADVIDPNAINIIDFLEITEEFYLVAREIKDLYDVLNKGICIVCLQKNPSSKFAKVDLGRGGALSLEKARLYLALDPNETRVIKAKNWRIPTKNPNGMRFTYNLIGGAEFVNVQEHARNEDDTLNKFNSM